MKLRRRAVLSAIVSSAIAITTGAACGQPGRYASWTTFRDPDDRYTIEYLAPPWELVDGDGSPVILRVPSNAAAVGGFDSAVSPKYELQITVVTGSPAALAAMEQASAPARGEEVVTPAGEIVTESGDVGAGVALRETLGELRHRRLAWVVGEAGTVVRLSLASVPDATEPEVDAMFRSLDVDPESP